MSALLTANVRRGRIGRRLVAVRGNERAAAALGVNVAGAKLFAFGLGAAMASLGGCFLAFRQTTINYASFAPFLSIAVVVYAVIGGVGFVLGALLAAPFAVGGVGSKVFDTLGFGNNVLNLFSGGLLLLLLLANPNGLAHTQVEFARSIGRRLRRRSADQHDPVVLASQPSPATRPPATLIVDSLTVRFGGVVAVDGVSFAVRPGEVLGLIGPNGAGKTTIIDAVTGFVSAATGSSIRLGDTSLDQMKPSQHARHGVGRSFQSVELFDDMTVLENLLAGSDDQSAAVYFTDLVRAPRTSVPRDVWEIIQAFGLEADLHQQPDQLPFGRRRLVGVARTVASRPTVLLLDEPAAGLSDPESRHLGEVIVGLARDREMAVLMIEHDVPLVSAICDRIVVLDFGRKIAEGPPDEVTTNELVLAAYLGLPETSDPPIAETST